MNRFEQRFITHDCRETQDAGFKFAVELRPGDVVALTGNLGAGKTHFVKGVAKAFGIEPDDVQSPTFAIVHEYSGNVPVFHLDCYRLESEQEALNIGIEEYFYRDGIALVEWPDVINSLIPDDYWNVTIEHQPEDTRRITIQRHQ